MCLAEVFQCSSILVLFSFCMCDAPCVNCCEIVTAVNKVSLIDASVLFKLVSFC